MKTYLLVFLVPVALLLSGCNVYYADKATKRGRAALRLGDEAKKHGDYQLADDNYRRAQLQFETAVDRDPNSTDRHFNLGRASQALRQYKRALEEYERALEYYPGNGKAHKRKIDCLIQMNAPQTQIDDAVFQAIGIVRQRGRIYLAQAAAYYSVGRAADIPPILARALAAAPDDAQVNAIAGRLYRAIGDVSSAKRCFTIAYQLDPDEPDVARDLGRLGERLPPVAEY